MTTKVLRVGIGQFQVGDRVKWRAGRTKRASRIGRVTAVAEYPIESGWFATCLTPGGLEHEIDYDDLELLAAHDITEPVTINTDERTAIGVTRGVSVSFTYTTDETIPRIATMDDLLAILSETPADLTITEYDPT